MFYYILLLLVIEFVELGQVMDFDSDSFTYKTKNEDSVGGGSGCLSEETARGYFKDLVDGMDYCKYFPLLDDIILGLLFAL